MKQRLLSLALALDLVVSLLNDGQAQTNSGGAGGGSGTLTGFSTTCPTGTSVSSGSVSLNGAVAVTSKTGSYATVNGDCGAYLVFNSASAVALTLTSSVTAPWSLAGVVNAGAGTLTITPSGGTINGSAGLTLTTGQGISAPTFDGTNWTATGNTGSGGGGLLAANNLSDVANPATARGNLSAAKSGANSDIASLGGLTTPLSVAQGGTGTATPGLVAGSNVTISGTWPNQTIASSGGGGGGSPSGSANDIQIYATSSTFGHITPGTGVSAALAQATGTAGSGLAITPTRYFVDVPSGSAISFTGSNATRDIATLSLPAGTFDCWANIAVTANGVTNNYENGWMNTVSVTYPATEVGTNLARYSVASSNTISLPIVSTRYVLGSPTTVYLSAQISGAANVWGQMTCVTAIAP